jgi:hypothetical protein
VTRASSQRFAEGTKAQVCFVKVRGAHRAKQRCVERVSELNEVERGEGKPRNHISHNREEQAMTMLHEFAVAP